MDNIDFKDLLKHCVNILDSHHYFTNKRLDVLINNNMNFYSENELYEKYIINKKITDDTQKDFIKEVVFGCVRYHKIIQLMLKYLFESIDNNLKDEDYTIFVVLSYLILFRLKELGYNNFKSFVDTQPTRKIYKLLELLFNEKNIAPDGCLKKIWKDLLDENYIEKELLEPLRSVLHQNKKIMRYLEKKINLGMSVKKTSKVTKIKPFCLTKPKPRSFPEPKEVIHRKIKSTVLSEKVLLGSKDKEILEKKKEENRLKLQKRHEKEKENQFEIVKKNIIKKEKVSKEKINENLPPSPKFQSSKFPKFKPIDVKLNIATVLREEKLLEKQKKKKESDLNNIEVNLNNNDFEEWMNKIKEKEYEERKLDELKKRFEIQLLHEDAIDAKEDIVKEKQEIVQQIKEEKEENQKFIEKEKEIQNKLNKQCVENVHNIEVKATIAKKKVTANKKKTANEIKDESKEIKMKIQKQQEEELIKKAEIIRQIRLLEKYLMDYKPVIDLTETPNYGFLNEMSIVELKQRLAIVKEAAKEEENRQRELILKRKQEKNIIMKKIRQNIENNRIIRSEQRIKNEKEKLERQKRLENLINEKKNVQTCEIFSLKSVYNTPPKNLDHIQSLYYQLQQRKEQRQKRRNRNKMNDTYSLSNSLYSHSNTPSNGPNLPSIPENDIESNTINLTLKSDKFVVIPNNSENNIPLNILPNVYESHYDSYQNNLNDIEKNREYDSSSDAFSSTYLIPTKKTNDGSDYYAKKQLKTAERKFEKKINLLRYQEKLYNEEMDKKQNEKKNMNVNFQLNEVKEVVNS